MGGEGGVQDNTQLRAGRVEQSVRGVAGACRLQEHQGTRRPTGKHVWGGALWEVGHSLG